MAIFNSFWHGGNLCPISFMCLNSFGFHGHKVNLYTYDQNIIVPSCVSVKDASLILDPAKIYEAHGGFESLSDVFRYKLLENEGGWWIDTDVVCNRADIPDTELVFAREGRNDKFANGQIKFPKNHPVMKRAVEHVESNPDTGWGTTGPILLTQLIQEAGLTDMAWNTSDLYPIFWAESAKFLLPEYKAEISRRTKDSCFTHIYTSRFRRRLNFDQRRFLPPTGSFLELLYFTYGCGPLTSNLTEIDETKLRSVISEHMQEEWIQTHLREKDIEFHVNKSSPAAVSVQNEAAKNNLPYTVLIPVFNEYDSLIFSSYYFTSLGIRPKYILDRKCEYHSRSMVSALTGEETYYENDKAFIENGYEAFADASPTDWILRLDCDELPTAELLKVCADLISGGFQGIAGFDRHQVFWQDKALMSATAERFKPANQRQWRLFNRRCVQFDTRIHTPGIRIEEGLALPPEACAYHLSWEFLNWEDRVAKANRYDQFGQPPENRKNQLLSIDEAGMEPFDAPFLHKVYTSWRSTYLPHPTLSRDQIRKF